MTKPAIISAAVAAVALAAPAAAYSPRPIVIHEQQTIVYRAAGATCYAQREATIPQLYCVVHGRKHSHWVTLTKGGYVTVGRLGEPDAVLYQAP